MSESVKLKTKEAIHRHFKVANKAVFQEDMG